MIAVGDALAFVLARLRDFTREDFARFHPAGSLGRKMLKVDAVMRQGDFLLWVAGNHLGALPVYDELSAQGESVLVVQFDAHLDIHQFRDCTAELSHGNFLLHCDGPLPPLVNAGHRDLLLPAEAVGRCFRHTFSAAEIAKDMAGTAERLRTIAQKAERVYLDIDCDVLDPAYFPAVGQATPFGLSPPVLLALIEAVWSPRVAGLCVSEFDPGRDRDDRSLAVLVWLIEYLLLRRHES